MSEHGWLTMHWPKEYGGRDAPIWEQVILREEMRIRNVPEAEQFLGREYRKGWKLA